MTAASQNDNHFLIPYYAVTGVSTRGGGQP